MSNSNDQLPKTKLGKVSVDGVANSNKASYTDNRSSENEDNHIEDVVQNGTCKKRGWSTTVKTIWGDWYDSIVTKVIVILNKSLKNTLSEIKKLRVKNGELKSKVNKKKIKKTIWQKVKMDSLRLETVNNIAEAKLPSMQAYKSC